MSDKWRGPYGEQMPLEGVEGQKPNPTPGECARVLDVVQALWEGNQGLADLILAGLGNRALPAALLCLDGSFTAAGEAMGVDKEMLLREAHKAFLLAMGDVWITERKP